MITLLSDAWPWWIAPLYIVGSIFYALTYPVAVLPFRATCHTDLWGNEPPYACLSYHCPKVKALGLDRERDWPQCAPWEQW